MNYPSRSFQVPSMHIGKCIIRNPDAKIPSSGVMNKGELMERLVSCVNLPVKNFDNFFIWFFGVYIISIVVNEILGKALMK